MILDLENLFVKYSFKPTGVLHVGAHVGQEQKFYDKIGIEEIVYIEANPSVYEILKKNVGKCKNVKTICCAVSNKQEIIPFYITSNTESSSILKLKYHSELYSRIVETQCIQVQAYTLDYLVGNLLDIDLQKINFINIDIQGAELLAFQGAEDLLENHIKVINTEINYKELYANCGLKSDIDKFLSKFGFVCKEVSCRYHPSWGDALYIKES